MKILKVNNEVFRTVRGVDIDKSILKAMVDFGDSVGLGDECGATMVVNTPIGWVFTGESGTYDLSRCGSCYIDSELLGFLYDKDEFSEAADTFVKTLSLQGIVNFQFYGSVREYLSNMDDLSDEELEEYTEEVVVDYGSVVGGTVKVPNDAILTINIDSLTILIKSSTDPSFLYDSDNEYAKSDLLQGIMDVCDFLNMEFDKGSVYFKQNKSRNIYGVTVDFDNEESLKEFKEVWESSDYPDIWRNEKKVNDIYVLTGLYLAVEW